MVEVAALALFKAREAGHFREVVALYSAAHHYRQVPLCPRGGLVEGGNELWTPRSHSFNMT